MPRAGVGIASLLAAAVVAGLVAPAARALSAEKELALRYAPVVRVVKPTQPCGHGEHFEPINVNVSVRSIMCIPRDAVAKSATASLSETQYAMWSSFVGFMAPTLPIAGWVMRPFG